MNFLKTLDKFKTIILAIVAIVSATIGSLSYFAKAGDLIALQQDYYQSKTYNRLNYLDQRITDLEIKYDCRNESCQNKMPIDLYKEYREKQMEKSYIEKNILKPEDIR